ncbi:leucine-rich repeat-containing protein 74B [Heptranchias perlo]|uniref:leucine-rich repeat-containing protein 74B n=1 Tax=Heptranchias perlo TaxID=212740 RepID=UPI0035593B72
MPEESNLEQPPVQGLKDDELEQVGSQNATLQLGGISSRPPARPRNCYSRGSVDAKRITQMRTIHRVKKDQEEICKVTIPPSEPSEKSSEDISDDEMLSDGGVDTDHEESTKVYDPTGKVKYKQACEIYGVVPISYFLRNMNGTELSMMHYGLGPQGAKAISVSLITNTSITKLNLKDNWLEAEGAKAIADMLKENCYIADVDLSDNQLGVEGAEAIFAMLTENSTLLKIVLSGNNFDDHTAKYLAKAISNTNNLQILNVSHNKIGDASGEELGNAIAESTGMKELNLSWNYLRGKGCIAIAEGLGDNVFLQVLDLSYNGFGNEGAKALGEVLKVNNVLEQLNISNNRISPEGAVYLSMGLRENTTLTVLNMARNPMQSAGCYAILKSIKDNPKSAIVSLDFSDIRVNKDFEDLFNDVKEQVPNLQVKHEKNTDDFKKPRSKADPLTKLKEYMKENHLLLEHFLDNFDIAESRCIFLNEFQEGLKNARVPLNEVEHQRLIELLDKEKDGEIDFRELNTLLLSN